MILLALQIVLLAFLAQTLFTAIVVVGWVSARVRRSMCAELCQRVGGGKDLSGEIEDAREPRRLLVNFAYGRRALLPLWSNLREGVVVLLCTWSFLVIPQILWYMSWYTGWHISFNKMYEESQTGISVALLGIGIFAVVMLLVPFGQARYALTQDWRVFFELRFLQRIMRAISFRYLLLALLYLSACLYVTLSKALPTFFPNFLHFLSELSDEELLRFLRSYYLATGLAGVALYYFLHLHAGRLYVAGLVAALQKGAITPEQLHPREKELFGTCLDDYTVYQTGALVKILGFPVKLLSRAALSISIVLVFGFIAFLVFAGQFAHYHPYTGFLNHPMIELPCFNYIPTGNFTEETPS